MDANIQLWASTGQNHEQAVGYKTRKDDLFPGEDLFQSSEKFQ